MGSVIRGSMGAMCCFCNQSIADGDVDPVELSVASRAEAGRPEGGQYLWCHAACLRAAVHASIPLAVEMQAEFGSARSAVQHVPRSNSNP
jgi:hypothetical protein